MSIGDCPNWPQCGHTSMGQCDADMLGRRAASYPALPEPDCWAILTPNGSKLVSPDEAKGRKDAYPLFTREALSAAPPIPALPERPEAKQIPSDGVEDLIETVLLADHGTAAPPISPAPTTQAQPTLPPLPPHLIWNVHTGVGK